MKNEFKGFSLFSDIEDIRLRTRNRAVVLCNIAEDNMRERRISPKGFSLILGYFGVIPDEEKNMVKDAFANQMKERGYVLATN